MAKSIMIQGTMSGVGKSLLTAGLCRILRQDGYRAAPFKSQNMALNSFITVDGLEMGRAQVMQAQAAGIEPDVRMNPILLKPTTDTGSQVIVNGEVRGDMGAREYFACKKSLMPLVLDAYASLSAQYDVIVIEGAGSPAEINLKKDDIVNMGLAKAVGAPVLLAGDIDRGGVFAQLLGTQMLLEPEEQALLKGLIVNKFRGDKTILDPGIRMLEERSGVPVVGVVPYMQLDIDEEDSLAPQLAQTNRAPSGKPLEIAARFPRYRKWICAMCPSPAPSVSRIWSSCRAPRTRSRISNGCGTAAWPPPFPGFGSRAARSSASAGAIRCSGEPFMIRTGSKRADPCRDWAFWIQRQYLPRRRGGRGSAEGSGNCRAFWRR